MSTVASKASPQEIAALVRLLREGEASAFAEGCDLSQVPIYQQTKQRPLAGEINIDQAVAIIGDHFASHPTVA